MSNQAKRISKSVDVGGIKLGGGNPVVIQSMTNTDTEDLSSTVNQILELREAGSEMVRLTVNTLEAAKNVPAIKDSLIKLGVDVPLIGDFHFNGDKLLAEVPDCAEALSKYRINPGNVGKGTSGDQKFAFIINTAIEHSKPVRIGVNWGSLDSVLAKRMMDENLAAGSPLSNSELMRKVLILSVLDSAKRAESLGLGSDKIVLSCKVSKVPDLIYLYRELASSCSYALHLGLTEAGMGSKGIVASTAALAPLLMDGIGDTIRISLTPAPHESRVKEVKVAQQILQSIGLRSFSPEVTACPGCGRTSSDFFQRLAKDVQDHINSRMPFWRSSYPGVENLTIAVMGCVVNGPGESKLADIGISLPGNGELPVAPVYIRGKRVVTLKGDGIAMEFKDIVEDFIKNNFENKSSLKGRVFPLKMT